MATKTDFSTTEWETLRDAPHAVVLAVAAAGASGLFGSIKEAMAPTGTLVEALHGENQLLRQICDSEEIKASIESLKGMAKSSGDFRAFKLSSARRPSTSPGQGTIYSSTRELPKTLLPLVTFC
jgi:hypothetical protein